MVIDYQNILNYTLTMLAFSLIITAAAAAPDQNTGDNAHHAPQMAQKDREQISKQTQRQDDNNDLEVPLIVIGKREEKQVIVGSRIARKPLYNKDTHIIRTSTGTGGLGPGSGMDPGAQLVRRTKVVSCKSDHPALPAKLTCDFSKAQQAYNNAEYGLAEAYLRHLDTSAANDPELSYLLLQERYRIAQKTGNDDARLRLLSQMADSEQMPQDRKLLAHRTRFAIAYRLEKMELALDIAGEIERLAPNDPVNLTNIKALEQQISARNQTQ